jgi:ribosome-binding protein aMBF1 (putative translation factor)
MSLEVSGKYVRHHRLKKGMTQKTLSQKIFDRPNPEYMGELERGVVTGMTFATSDKIMMALDLEMR